MTTPADSRSWPLIIFDFDGVIADSEFHANQVLADRLTAAGYPTTLDETFQNYLGRNWQDCERRFRELWSADFPPTLRLEIDAAIEQRLPELKPVDGVCAFVRAGLARQQCIASSSDPVWIERRLRLFSLEDAFEGAIFSAAVHVRRGKPHPDIYLHAAQAMGCRPERALVIEDSTTGVTAAVAAGAQVVGLCAASHVRDGHAERLRAAGAHHICRSFSEVERLLA